MQFPYRLLRLLAAMLPISNPLPMALAEQRPNVLFIAVDDLRPELNCYGASHIRSPNIDRLAAGGTLFERAYCMVPVCGASRASLMTGIRPAPGRFTRFNCRADRDAPGVTTLNTWFKEQGYRTLSLGKVFHVPEDNAHGWSEPPWRFREPGFPQYRIPENQRLHEQREKEEARQRGPAFESADVDDDAYVDGQTALRATAEMRRLSQDSAPFFLAVGFLKPHLPFNAPKKYWDMYDRARVSPPSNNFAPEGAPKESLHTWGELRAYANIPSRGPVDSETARNLVHGYYACASYADAMVGRVLDELDRLQLADKTIVVLWGDHGWNLGEHTLWCKHSCYETSMRVPLIVRAPGGPKGKRTEQIVESIDLYPTLCELAGLAPPSHLDGKSLVPALNDPATTASRVAAGRYGKGDTIRTPQYRFTEYAGPQGAVSAEMLYDHKSDPDENRNLIDDPKYRQTIEQLRVQLHHTKGRKSP